MPPCCRIDQQCGDPSTEDILGLSRSTDAGPLNPFSRDSSLRLKPIRNCSRLKRQIEKSVQNLLSLDPRSSPYIVIGHVKHVGGPFIFPVGSHPFITRKQRSQLNRLLT